MTFKANAKGAIRCGLAVALLSSCAPAALHAETSNAELAKEIAELKAQIRAMRGAIAETRTETRRTSAKVRAAGPAYALPPPGPAIPVGAVPAFVTADKKLQFGAITITPGGYLEAASVFRSKATESDLGSNFSGLPFPNNVLGNTNEFRFSARQSRVSLLAEAPITPTMLASGYLELDFLGAASTANENQTNSYTPRIRNLYATLDNSEYGFHVLAGQNWSLVTLNTKGITPRNELLPANIDSNQNVGSVYARQPQIRLTKDFNKQLWAAISVEESQTTGCPGLPTNPAAYSTGLPGYQIGSSNITAYCASAGSGGNFIGAQNAGPFYSFNHIPDVIGKVAYEGKLADHGLHLEAMGLYTDLYDRVQTTNTGTGALTFANKDTTGYGVGGGLVFQVIPKTLDFQVNGLYGKGINRYGPGQLPDATLNADGSLRPLTGYIGLAGLTFHATPALDIYGYAGVEGENRAFSVVPGGYIGIGAPDTNNTGCYTEGVGKCNGATRRLYEITGGFWDKLYSGAFGEVRAGIQYSYLNREIFGAAGFGTTPVGPNLSANESIVFSSLRYYPFAAPPAPPVIAKY